VSPVQSRQIFVNLPVKNLDKSVEFFTQLGFEFNPQFTDENATCMIINDDAFVMLLVEDFFKTFIKKSITDAATQTETIIALSAESREQVDEIVDKALAAGGQPASDPIDQGFMYVRSFQDPDGHIWEAVYMDPSAIEQ
jgi:predicted lactoylglutathione lyase